MTYNLHQLRPVASSDSAGYFGSFGGQYIPETLVEPLYQLEELWNELCADETYRDEFSQLLQDYVGRPTPLYQARNIGKELNCKVYLKREDLCHTGAHKINNSLGQCLLAKHMGKTRVIAETGAGQHGVATASVAALLGLQCCIYMGSRDIERQYLNVLRMRQLGAEVIAVDAGQAILKDALSEALRDWVASVDDTHYVIGTAAGPHPFPHIVRELQRVIGEESKRQIVEFEGRLPDAVVACVGGGSNAIGIFSSFLADSQVKLYGVEAGGISGEDGQHCTTLGRGRPGILHGFRSLLLQSASGMVQDTHSISAGLDYPGVGPEHAYLHETERVKYMSATDAEAMQALNHLCRSEGLLPALESSHALAALPRIAEELPADSIVLVNLSGRGDKDMPTIAEYSQRSDRAE